MSSVSPFRILVALSFLCLAAWLGWVGGPANAFDRLTILRLMDTRVASHSLTSAAIAATWLGSAYVTLGSTALASAWRWVQHDRRSAVWLALTVGGGRLLADGMKLVVARPRPHFMPYPVPVSSFSFPSGHAANSMLAFTALALVLSARRWQPITVTVAVLASIGVGLTRPYLGVHWPSDVLAGWLIAGAVIVLAAPFRTNASRTAA